MIYLFLRLILKLLLWAWRSIFGWLDSEPKTFHDWKERVLEEDIGNPYILRWSLSPGPTEIDLAIKAIKLGLPNQDLLIRQCLSLQMKPSFLSEYYPSARMDEGRHYKGKMKPKYITKRTIDDFHTLLRENSNSNLIGNTALCLSGGGGLGVYHVGVVIELEERSLLPKIISGSSVGSFIAAMSAIHPSKEWTSKISLFTTLKLLTAPLTKEERGQKLKKIIKDTIGEWTFMDLYIKKGITLLIPITKAEETAKVEGKTVHYRSDPHIFIWSAVLASCSIPPLFPPVPLESAANDDDTPQIDSSTTATTTTWMDGSIHQDIPISQTIRKEFQITHTLISQVNPHIYPFLRWVIDVDGRKSIFSRIIAPLLKKEILLRLDQLSPLHPWLPFLRRIIKQRYYGDTTILVRIPIRRFWFLINEPTPEFIQEAIQEGRRATWPKIHLLQNRMA